MSTPIKTEDSAFLCQCNRKSESAHEEVLTEIVEQMFKALGLLAGSYFLCDRAALVVTARLASKVMQTCDAEKRAKYEEHYMLLLETEFGTERTKR